METGCVCHIFKTSHSSPLSHQNLASCLHSCCFQGTLGPLDNWQLRQMTKSKDLSCVGNHVMSTSYGGSTYVGISNSQTKGNGNKRTINLCIFFSKQNNKNSGKTPSNICQSISNHFKLGYTLNKQPGFWPLTRPMNFSDQSICNEFLSVQHYGLNMAVSPCECHVSHLETLYIYIYIYICKMMYVRTWHVSLIIWLYKACGIYKNK